MGEKVKKSFKKYATKHLAAKIQSRRIGAKGRKEKAERIGRRMRREHDEAHREEKEHKDELEKLKDMDPSFHAYLEEEDPTLLQFGDENIDLVDDAEGSDAETDEDEDDDGEGAKETKLGRLQKSDLKAAVQSKNVQTLVEYFISAAREMGAKITDRAQGNETQRKFEDPNLVKDTLVQAAQALSEALPSLVKADKAAGAGRDGAGTTVFKTPKGRSLIKRFLLTCISVIADCGSDNVLAARLLKASANFVTVLHLIRGCTKALLKVALHTCSSGDESLRVSAYMVVRRLATRAAGSRSMYQSSAFKGIFLALVRSANNYNVHTLDVIGFLMNAVVDLYGTDVEAAYQHTFVYLRQLAIYLRAALQQQSQANVRTVFNWQFVNALRTWGLVISAYPAPEQLGPLLHPVVQLSLGVMDLFSSPRCYPMHLHILKMLNQLSTRGNGVYIPIATYILRILSSPSLALDRFNTSQGGKKGRGDGDEADAGDLQFQMRVKKAHQKSQAYVISVWQESLYLLSEHLATHSHSIGFPEAFWTVSSTLNKLRKTIRLPKINQQITNILGAIQSVSNAIKTKKENITFGPCDAQNVKIFEDELKVAQSNSPFKALVRLHEQFHKARTTDYEAKRASQQKRTTLESVAEKNTQQQRSVGGKTSRRAAEDDDEEFDANEYVEGGDAGEGDAPSRGGKKSVRFAPKRF